MFRIHLSINAMAVLSTVMLLPASTTFAQHHDIEFSYEAGKIAIEFGDEGHVFEGNWENLDGSYYTTDDPGFGSEVDEGLGIDPGDFIRFNVLGPLLFHNGSGFAPLTATSVFINGAGPGPNVVVDSSTTSGSGFVGQADSGGTLHSHIEFLIADSAPIGAYGLLLSLTAFDEFGQLKGIEDSDPFYLVLNLGLDEEVFEAAVGAFAAQVPEPSAVALVVSGLAALVVYRRRLG